MAIANINNVFDSLANNFSRFVIDKASITTTSPRYVSLWKVAGRPSIGLTPTTPVVHNNTNAGAIGFTQQTAPATSYLGIVEYHCSQLNSNFMLYDRLMSRASLNGTLTTAQAVDIDLDLNLATSNLADRIGRTDYTEVTWFIECYTNTGATGVNATVNVTYHDSTSGNIVVPYGATTLLGQMYPLNPYIPQASMGKGIMRVNTVQLSATTGTAGNFGVTAMVEKISFGTSTTMYNTRNWLQTNLKEIKNNSCMVPVVILPTTSTGIVRATGKIIHG